MFCYIRLYNGPLKTHIHTLEIKSILKGQCVDWCPVFGSVGANWLSFLEFIVPDYSVVDQSVSRADFLRFCQQPLLSANVTVIAKHGSCSIAFMLFGPSSWSIFQICCLARLTAWESTSRRVSAVLFWSLVQAFCQLLYSVFGARDSGRKIKIKKQMQIIFKHTCTDTHTQRYPAVERYISITTKLLLVCNKSTGTDSLCSFTEIRSVDQPKVKFLTTDQSITVNPVLFVFILWRIRDIVAFLLLFLILFGASWRTSHLCLHVRTLHRATVQKGCNPQS